MLDKKAKPRDVPEDTKAAKPRNAQAVNPARKKSDGAEGLREKETMKAM